MNVEPEPAGIKIYGPVGEALKSPLAWSRGLPAGSDGYAVSTERIEVSLEAQIIGERTHTIFLENFKRPRRWDILYIPEGKSVLAEVATKLTQPLDTPRTPDLDGGSYRAEEVGNIKAYVVITRESANSLKSRFQNEVPEGGSANLDIKTEVIDLDRIKNEVIDENVAYMLESALVVEEYLSDYGTAGERDFREYEGLGEAYHQWIEQEALHRLGLEAILTRVKVRKPNGEIVGPFRTPEQIQELRRNIRRRRWIEPFKTPSELTVYPMGQEEVTAEIYTAASAKVEKEAPTVAKILKLIAGDEKDHYNWFTTAVMEFARFDPVRTAKDVYNVWRHFQMPADDLLSPKGPRLKSFQEVVGVSLTSIARQLYKVGARLNTLSLEFIDLRELRTAVSEYAGIDPEDNKLFQQLILARPRSRMII